MSAGLTVAAAALAGLAASTHCVAMCGGIGGALALATARDADGRPRRSLLVAYQAGRIASYTLAGLVVGTLGDRLLAWLDLDAVRTGLRLLTALAIAATALSLLGRARAPGIAFGLRVWPALSRLGRRLLPVSSLPRAFAFGMIWGWMPCGLAYAMLLAAALAATPFDAAATMLAFGLGTAPAMLATAWSATTLTAWIGRAGVRRGAGYALLLCAALVATAPWIAAQLPGAHAWLPFDCVAGG